MIEAELKGKLPEIENSEDILTSCIFGLTRYLPVNDGILKILKKTEDYNSRKSLVEKHPELKKYDQANYFFWENSNKYGEPDLIIIFESKKKKLVPLILVVEIKYYSSKSRVGEYDQLKDYFFAVSTEKGRNTFSRKEISGFKGKFLGLVYLTYYTQREEVESTIKEIEKQGVFDTKKQIYELRWNDITKALEDGDGLSVMSKKVNEDILSLLRKKNFIDFKGWTSVPFVTFNNIFLNKEEFFKDIPVVDKKKEIFYGGS